MRSSVLDSQRIAEVEIQNAGFDSFYPPPRKKDPQRRPRHQNVTTFLRRLFSAPEEGWSALALLAIALYCVVVSIIEANWVGHGFQLLWCPVGGLLVGLLIARTTRIPQAILHLGSCLLGYWQGIWLTSVVAYHVRWLLLLAGLRDALTGNIASGSISTEILFFFYLAFLSYFLGYFGSWLVYRARLPWLVAMVYCSILLVNLNYVKHDSPFLVIIAMGALALLIARVQLANQVQSWIREGLYTNAAWVRGLTWRCMQVASVLTLIVLIVSMLLPIQGQSAAGRGFWDRVDNAWTNMVNGHISWQDPAAAFQPYQSPSNFFGNQLEVTGSVHLPPGEVMEYTSTTGPHYLEGFTLNLFDGHTWTSSLTDNAARSFDANAVQPPDADSANAAMRITTAVTVVQPPQGQRHYIFAPAQPISFDVPTMVYMDGTAVTWTQQSPLTAGETYHVVSLLPPMDPAQLSSVPLPQADPAYWRADVHYAQLALYYTQVPHDLSPNVTRLTNQWTQGATDAYIALKMLERHLGDQTQFTYSVDNPPIPSNIDAVDWLLQKHNGYCTYYASAMAVMGRLLGIPMRVVNGFSSGHYDAAYRLWIVNGSDAHSWVQAYFPNYGWISFDPTPGYSQDAAPPPQSSQLPHPAPTPTKRQKLAPMPTPPVKKASTPIPDRPTPVARVLIHRQVDDADILNQAVLLWLSFGLLFLSILVFLAAVVTYWWRNLYANSSPASGLFWRLCWIASLAGLSPRIWQTPYEYSEMLSRHLPQGTAPLRRLTELFVRDRWATPYQAPYSEEEIEQLWPVLRSMLLQLFLKRRKK